MSFENQVISGLKWTALAKLSGQLFAWFATLWVIRLLSPDDYGIMAIATLIMTISVGMAELGIGASIVQARTLDPKELSQLAGLIISVNLAAGLILVLLAPILATLFHEPRLTNVIRVCALQFVSNALGSAASSLVSRNLAFRWLALTTFLSSLASSVLTLGLAIGGAGVWALVWGPILDGAIRSSLLVLKGGWVRPSFRFNGIGRHLRFGGVLTFSRMMWLVTYQSDIMIAGRMLPSAVVGTYSVALHLATLPMQKIMGTVNQVAFPAIARLQDDLPHLRGRLLQAINLMCTVSVPILWGISAVSTEFVDVFLGEKWREVALPLAVISLVVPIRMVSAILWTAVLALGRVEENLMNTVINAFVLPASFLLGIQGGADGLAFAWLVAIPLVTLLNFPRVARTVGVDAKGVLASVRVSAVAGAGMWLTVHAARLQMTAFAGPVKLACLVAIGAGVYLALTHLLDRETFGRMQKFIRMAKGG